MTARSTGLGLLFLVASTGAGPARAETSQHPSLVLWITVDQLRGDMPDRYLPAAAEGGFRRLARRGVSFANAHYRHATTFTAVGHAALFTGGEVAQHGIASNDWYDIAERRDIDAVQDDVHPLIGRPPARGKGFSPANLTSTTILDEIVLASAGRARAFSVSAKDRGAILPAGRMGKAFWYSKDSGEYVTSTFYYREYPAWAKRWNDARPVERYREAVWSLKDGPETYLHRDRDDRPCEKGYKHLARTFPHALATDTREDFFSAVAYTPFSDELTLEFALAILEHEQLGRRGETDALAVSLSATDLVDHVWGVESLEAEDNLRRVDAVLARLLQAVDRHVGLDRTLIVLASDHGTDEVPECTAAYGLPAGRHDSKKFMRSLNDALRARFRTDCDLVTIFWNPSLYLDLDAIARRNLDLVAGERALADEVLKLPGFARAMTRTDLLTGRVPDDPVARRVQASFHPTRSGHVMVVPSQFWYLYHDPNAYAAIHGTPWSYDTFVPVIVAGPGIRPQRVRRTIAPECVAPTVAAFLGIKPPSGCTAEVLPEALPDPSPAHGKP